MIIPYNVGDTIFVPVKVVSIEISKNNRHEVRVQYRCASEQCPYYVLLDQDDIDRFREKAKDWLDKEQKSSD